MDNIYLYNFEFPIVESGVESIFQLFTILNLIVIGLTFSRSFTWVLLITIIENNKIPHIYKIKFVHVLQIIRWPDWLTKIKPHSII